MFLKKISLFNFKNYSEAQFDFSEDINCFSGNNGVGKTNLLDAIHYLSFCKSYFNSTDYLNIRHGSDFFILQGDFVNESKEETIYCSASINQRKIFKKNKKEYSRLSEHIGLFPSVVISPEDTNLIHEGSRARRKFLDSVISQFNKTYLENLINYNKALEQRDALLKNFAESGKFDLSSLLIWNKPLIENGDEIYQKRKEFLKIFIPVFQKYFKIISGGAEPVSLDYQSGLNQNSLQTLLDETIIADRNAQRTTSGIHKDDLIFKLGGHPLKTIGSQGQQKSFIIAMKLAQFECIKEIKKFCPILLLDDIFDKLDHNRINSLMNLVSTHHFGQIFITNTEEKKIREIFKKIKIDLKLFKIGENKNET